jgi:hypothetical protein
VYDCPYATSRVGGSNQKKKVARLYDLHHG